MYRVQQCPRQQPDRQREPAPQGHRGQEVQLRAALHVDRHVPEQRFLTSEAVEKQCGQQERQQQQQQQLQRCQRCHLHDRQRQRNSVTQRAQRTQRLRILQ